MFEVEYQIEIKASNNFAHKTTLKFRRKLTEDDVLNKIKEIKDWLRNQGYLTYDVKYFPVPHDD